MILPWGTQEEDKDVSFYLHAGKYSIFDIYNREGSVRKQEKKIKELYKHINDKRAFGKG